MRSRCPNKPNKCKYDTCWESKRNKGRTVLLFFFRFFFLPQHSIQAHLARMLTAKSWLLCLPKDLLAEQRKWKYKSRKWKQQKYRWLFMRLYWKILIYLLSKTAATRWTRKWWHTVSAAWWHLLCLYATKSKHINAIINRDLLELTLPPVGGDCKWETSASNWDWRLRHVMWRHKVMLNKCS